MKKILFLTIFMSFIIIFPGYGEQKVKESLGSVPGAGAKNSIGQRKGDSLANNSAVNGINVGAQIGYVKTDSKTTISFNPALGRTASDKSDISGHGVISGIHLGWGYLTEETIYMGLEINANKSNADGKKTVNETLLAPVSISTKIELTQTYDLSARFGYLMYHNSVLPYLKAGITWGKWKANTITNWDSVGSSSKYQTGFIVGAGADIAISDELTLGGEYTFSDYGSFNHKVIFSTGLVTNTVKIEPRVNSVMLNVRYKVIKSPF